ncbi:hypothetical protein GIB67_019320 [Kingdonia uniflora]|uniref:Thioredoxin domain-containing protein n=1 Tax=Kingdonia uniflora TaxID=39325 RepID=A0A7J7M1I5_9MAGN|nr:hypothetical protein GIB67_019320 [Kingdonia uniflora]
MGIRVLEIGFVLLVLFGSLTWAEPVRDSSWPVCPLVSIKDSFLGSDGVSFTDSYSLSNGVSRGVCVTEGDDVSLQKVLNLVHSNSQEYVAVLFYASWCPFSRSCRPTFATLSSWYPSIRHFAVEESSIRPSILSRYGVHGFPTLFLLNSTMRVRYHGSRTINSLVNFYSDVTGTNPLDQKALENNGNQSNLTKLEDNEQENCPFSWAKSPENMLRQETYLTLATIFVVLKFLYVLLPSLLAHARAWRRHIRITSLRTLCEQPLALFNQATQLFKGLKEPCKRSNLQEGALSARAWASKSLASVSIGEASSSRGSERR